MAVVHCRRLWDLAGRFVAGMPCPSCVASRDRGTASTAATPGQRSAWSITQTSSSSDEGRATSSFRRRDGSAISHGSTAGG
jgi:hypothetical protein